MHMVYAKCLLINKILVMNFVFRFFYCTLMIAYGFISAFDNNSVISYQTHNTNN